MAILQGKFEARVGQRLRELHALEMLEQSPDLSQRDLARRLGVAVGVANACIGRMADTGLIKIERINSRNLSYALTPAGFAAKARLSLEYARITIDWYREAKRSVTEGLSVLGEMGVERVGIVGANEVAEIVGVVCAHRGIVISAIADDSGTVLPGSFFMGLPVCSLDDLAGSGCEAIVVTHLEDDDFWITAMRQLAPGLPILKAF